MRQQAAPIVEARVSLLMMLIILLLIIALVAVVNVHTITHLPYVRTAVGFFLCGLFL